MAVLSLHARCPAKLNLTLHILGKRPDGFHELESWVAPIGLFDDLRVDSSDAISLAVTPVNAAPTDESNLVIKAARLLAAQTGSQCGANIHLGKRIPSGAGLGGGSSDAAHALVVLNQLWNTECPQSQIDQLAAQLGSDVPLFLRNRQVIMRGRGEVLEDVRQPWQGWAVLVMPSFAIATADVYRAYQATSDRTDSISNQPERFSHARAAADLMPLLFNDLESAAFIIEPRLKAMHKRINGHENRIVRMTGSGSAMFSLFDSENHADEWQQGVQSIIGDRATLATVPLLG